MRNVVRVLGLISIAAVFAGSCAPQTEVVKLYDDQARAAKTYKRLLVVAISSDYRHQRQFESEIVQRLRQMQVDATPSYTDLDASSGLLQNDIDRVGEAAGADGILVTHVASVDTSISMLEGRADIESTCRGGDPVDYFLYDHKIVREPDSVKVAHTVVVITNMYDAGSRNRVWTIQSTCFEKTSMSDVLVEEANAIVRQLRIDQLI
ncbi:MAG: hypothetical protein WBM76_11710 [Woeseiaceae bacterium]|jgi:hypothetical protein